MLVVLKLSFVLDLDCPEDTICFPKLKVLHLLGNTFKRDYSVSNLINSSCLVLETLNIIRGVVDHLRYLAITSLTINRLKIFFLNCYWANDLPFETLIDVPALEYLELRDYFTKKYVLGDFGSVVQAKIDVETHCAAELLCKIVNVQKLLLREHVWALEGTKTLGLPGFHYLTYLEFFTCTEAQNIEWSLVLEFLTRIPALEDIFFQKMKFVLGEEFDLTSEQDVPSCLLSSLKKCEFGLLDDKETEIEVIGYFLKNSKVLEHMIINSFDRVNVNKQATSALSRGSSECEIHYRSESFDSMLAKRDVDNSNHITWFS